MSATATTGAALIIIAIVIASAWGIWVFIIEPEIPILIRAIMLIIGLGFVALLSALIVERVKDMKKEHYPKR
ncbi:MAG: hypothetical protein ABIF08_01125 [Nanoarchaeota archaeon]